MTKHRTRPIDATTPVGGSWREHAWNNRNTSLFLLPCGLSEMAIHLERATVMNVSWTSLLNALVVIHQPMPWGKTLVDDLCEGSVIDIVASYTGFPRDDHVDELVVIRFSDIREIAFETSQLIATASDEAAVITVGVAFGCALEFIIQEDEDE